MATRTARVREEPARKPASLPARDAAPPQAEPLAERPRGPVPAGRILSPPEVLALQRTIGNRAVMRLLGRGGPSGPVVQRYHEEGTGLLGGYTPGTGAQAPNFEFQRLGVEKTYDRARSVETYTMHAEQRTEATPRLRVSDTNDLAVPQASRSEAKVFYATPEMLEQSNRELHDAGSPLRLAARAGRVTVPRSGPAPSRQLVEVAPDLGEVNLENHECGAFAREVLGPTFDHAEVDTGGGPHLVDGLGARNPATRDNTINTTLNGQGAEQVGGNEEAAPRVGEAYGIFARTTVPQPQGTLGAMVNALGQVASRLLSTTPYLQWGEHWAGVVARSGGDAVTLENYNRRVSDVAALEEAVEKDHKELRGIESAFKIGDYEQATAEFAAQDGENALARLRRLGKNYQRYAVAVDRNVHGVYHGALERWYFQMYGRGAQSFHAAWKGVVPGAVTFSVRGSDAELQGQLGAKLQALVPAAYRNATQGVLDHEVNQIGHAAGRDAIIAAYVAGERRLCQRWLAVARNRKLKRAQGRRNGKRRAALHRKHDRAAQEVRNATGDAVFRAARAGVQAIESV